MKNQNQEKENLIQKMSITNTGKEVIETEKKYKISSEDIEDTPPEKMTGTIGVVTKQRDMHCLGWMTLIRL